jgi:hypothetical protein
VIRLNLTVEGQTEQALAVQVLAEHLAKHGVCLKRPRLTSLGKKKGKEHRGGLVRYQPFKRDIERWLKQDRGKDVFFTTMVDLYRLPKGFPGYEEARAMPAYARVAELEKAFQEDVGDSRFIAYIQLHEFEALLLSAPEAFACYYARHERQIGLLSRLTEEFQSPELIDDGHQTAPSKRIGSLIPEYLDAKPTAGPIIAAHIGLEAIRKKCPHFHEWLTKLEGLGGMVKQASQDP